MSPRYNEEHFEIEKGVDMSENGHKEHPEMKARARFGHFNMHALDARDGSVLWKHDGFDVKTEQYSKSLPQFAFKLDKRDLMAQVHRAPSVADWTVFKESLVAELPHDWHSRDDTSIRIAHFERHHVGSGAASQATGKGKLSKKSRGGGGLFKGGSFTGVGSAPLSTTAALPHDAAEHTDQPNELGTVQKF